MSARFWLGWSGRDIRRRLPQVVAIATVIALATGLYAGLNTTTRWRTASVAASVADLDARDIEVALTIGTLPDETLIAAIDGGSAEVVDVETRFVAQASVSVGDVFAVGEVVGVDLADGPRLDRWNVRDGRDLHAADRDVVVVDHRFVEAHGLPDSGELIIGGLPISYVGTGLSPAHLTLNTTVGDALQGAVTRAVMFAPVELARRIGGVESGANVALVRLADGADAPTVANELAAALDAALPIPATVTAFEADPSRRAVVDEIESEDQLFGVFTVLVLAGAIFAAFNLVRRTVESQRRDIGVAMSLGVPPSSIAIRPLLLALGITTCGVLLGAIAGWAIARFVWSLMDDTAPLPVAVTPFEWGPLVRALGIGFLAPLLASLYPVWRAVHVRPVEALQPAHLAAGRRRQRFLNLVRRVRLPATVLHTIPIGRILRSPVRSAFTVAGIAFVVAPLLAALGATDSTNHSLDKATNRNGEALDTHLSVDLVELQAVDSDLVAEIADDDLVRHASAGLNVGGYAQGDDVEFPMSIAMVDTVDPVAAPWWPDDTPAPEGIVLSRPAADDLSVDVGDTFELRHPLVVGARVSFVESEVPVSAIHDLPFRFVAYMDLDRADLMGLEGFVNTVAVEVVDAASVEALQRELASTAGVASVLTAEATAATIRSVLELIDRLFIVLQVVIAALVFLVAYNTSSLGFDERTREHATMFAYGVPVRRVIGNGVVESALVGAVGTALGAVLGVAMLRWMLTQVFPAAVPDMSVTEMITTESYVITVAIGLLASTLAPLLNLRRLRRLNLPTTLRYTE